MTISEALSKIATREEILNFVNNLKPSIGWLGGRRFSLEGNGGSVSLNDVVKRTSELFPSFSQDRKTMETTDQFISRIKKLDSDASEKLANSFWLFRKLTDLKRWWSGAFKREVLDEIEKTNLVIAPVVERDRILHSSLTDLTSEITTIELNKGEGLTTEKEASFKQIKQVLIDKLCRKEDGGFRLNEEAIQDAFKRLKERPSEFVYLAHLICIHTPLGAPQTCDFLAALDWPTEDLKEKEMPHLAHSILKNAHAGILKPGEISIEGNNNLKVYEVNLDSKTIFGLKNSALATLENKALSISLYLAKGVGLLLRELGELSLKELNKTLQEERNELRAGLKVSMGKEENAQYAASLFSPLLPYLIEIPGLLSLEIGRMGIRSPSQTIFKGNRPTGFGDKEVGHLLKIITGHPHLQNVLLNLDAMSDTVLPIFKKEWEAFQKIQRRPLNSLLDLLVRY